jgi:acyl-CoA hydrolase
MENHKLVLPGNLNHYGYLFGGDLLKWVDEFAWIAATLDYPECNFVTLGMDKVEFKKSVKQGTILKFYVEKAKKGTTSVTYQVHVYPGASEAEKDLIFSTHVSFVRIGANGQKIAIPE